MHFFLDEHLSHRLVNRLITAGHGADSVDLLGMKGWPDEELLWFARMRGWVFVSIDEDYLLVHRALRRWGITAMHAGILTLPDQMPPPAFARALDIFASEGLPITDRLYLWDTAQGGRWIQYAPALRDGQS
jgi:predicted nuclease of predicted toxin-antitoxin system